MGVHGLWRLIEPSGKPVPLETLENKILAVDISIWLHQAVKGFQDARGASLPNAHLLGIYHRLCKLLYFRIKPVFIFDGGVPVLKKQTIARRSQHSSKIRNDATSIQQKILSTLLKHSAIQKVISESDGTETTTSTAVPIKSNAKDDMFALPDALPNSELDSTLDSDYSDTETSDSSPTKQWDLHTIDEKSPHFTSLPADVRHDILTDLKEQRKQSSWGRLHELPKQSGDFSCFQMKRLLKRYSVQVCLEEATKEMGGHTLSLNELEALLTEEGIVTASKTSTRRIASDENKSYLLIKDVKKAMEQAKNVEQKAKELETNPDNIKPETSTDTKQNEEIGERDSEYERDLKAAIELSLQGTPSTSKEATNYDYLESLNDGDFMSESSDSDDCTKDSKYVLSAAESYMLEFSDLTPHEIANIVSKNDKKGIKSSKKSKSKLDKILEIPEDIDIDDKIETKVESENLKEDSKSQTEIIENKIELNNEINSKTLEIMSDSDGSDLVEVEEKKDLIPKCNISTKTEVNNEIINDIDSEYDDDLKAAIALSLQTNIESDTDITKSVSNDTNSDSSNVLLEEKVKIPNSFSFTEIISSVETNKNNDPTKESVDILTESETIEVMSDSDDSDFVEVDESTSNPPHKKPAIEVVIKPIAKIEDDLFSDIFATPIPKIPEAEFKVPLTKVTEISKKDAVDLSEISVIETKDIQATEKIESLNELKEAKEESVVSKNEPKKVKNNKPKLTVEELNKLKSDLIKDQQELIAERNSKERMASDITNQMYLEAQELLELFGCPYIVAPMEAEAQCAFLNLISLTDGTITDDSDIWLFGGQTVYKNFFNQKKHVMEYRAERIKQCYKLSREQMILLALLVGSDYTLGIQGIGPVTALEILAAFPPAKNLSLSQPELLSGLSEFKHWLTDGRILGPGRTALRSKLQNISITEGFPSLSVVQAYLQPEVETCRDAFSWGKPDFVALIDYAREKFGWTRLKTEEILKPVIKKLEDLSKQKSIRDFFSTKHKVELGLVETKMSKRVKIAIDKMGKSRDQLSKDEIESEKTKKGSRRKVNLKKLKDKQTEKDKDQINIEPTDFEDPIDFEERIDFEEPMICEETQQANKQVNNESKEQEKPKKGTRQMNVDKLTKEKPTKSSENKPRGRRPRNDNPEYKSRAQRKRKIDPHEEDPIPQRETDKINALKTKLRAIEVFRKSKIDQKSGKRKPARKPKEEAELSESSDSS